MNRRRQRAVSVFCNAGCFDVQSLLNIAASGRYAPPWEAVRALINTRMTQVVRGFLLADASAGADAGGRDALAVSTRTGLEDGEDRIAYLHLLLDDFIEAPFTLQRLCEILLVPQRHFSNAHKLMNGIQKVLEVSSTLPPSPAHMVQVDHCHWIFNALLYQPPPEAAQPVPRVTPSHHAAGSPPRSSDVDASLTAGSTQRSITPPSTFLGLSSVGFEPPSHGYTHAELSSLEARAAFDDVVNDLISVGLDLADTSSRKRPRIADPIDVAAAARGLGMHDGHDLLMEPAPSAVNPRVEGGGSPSRAAPVASAAHFLPFPHSPPSSILRTDATDPSAFTDIDIDDEIADLRVLDDPGGMAHAVSHWRPEPPSTGISAQVSPTRTQMALRSPTRQPAQIAGSVHVASPTRPPELADARQSRQLPAAGSSPQRVGHAPAPLGGDDESQRSWGGEEAPTPMDLDEPAPTESPAPVVAAGSPPAWLAQGQAVATARGPSESSPGRAAGVAEAPLASTKLRSASSLDLLRDYEDE